MEKEKNILILARRSTIKTLKSLPFKKNIYFASSLSEVKEKEFKLILVLREFSCSFNQILGIRNKRFPKSRIEMVDFKYIIERVKNEK